MGGGGGDDDDDGLSVWSAHLLTLLVFFVSIRLLFFFFSSPACKPSILNKSGLMCFVCFQFQARLRHPKTNPKGQGPENNQSNHVSVHQQRATQRGHSHAPRRFVVCTLLAQMRRDPATCASLINLTKQLLVCFIVNQINLQFSHRSHTKDSRGLVKYDNLSVLSKGCV